MSEQEKDMLAWYRSLPTKERLAVNAFLSRGDARLIAWLRPERTALQQFDFDYLRAYVLRSNE